MAHRDDVVRVLARCTDCDSVYAAREWPSGEIQLIGQETCECGSTAFVTVEESDIPSDSDETDSASSAGDE